MTFTTLFLTILVSIVFLLLLWKLAAVFFAPYFVCKLPEKLGLVNLHLNSPDYSSFCVYCASEDSIYNLFNLFPWESRGILSFNDNEICYEGSKYIPSLYRKLGLIRKRPPRVRHYFDKQKVKITYIPPRFWRDGGLTWMRMEVEDTPYYFTTGRSRLGIIDVESDSESTTGLYKMVSEV
jgi:hypothetical protein